VSLRVDDVTVLDPAPEGPRVLEDVQVRVADGRVEQVGAGLPGADRVVDGEGGLLVPGLVNAHAHVAMTLLRGYAEDLPLERWLRDRVWPIEAHLTPERVLAGARLGCMEMLASGVTAFADMYLFEGQVARAAREAGVACLAGANVADADTAEGPGEEAVDRAEAFLDEHPPEADGRVRGSLAPHSAYTCSGETLEACAELADRTGARLQTHVAETRREVYTVEADTGRRPLAQLDAAGCLREGTILAHGGWLTKGEARRIGEAGAGLAHCPTSNMKLATGGRAPVPELREAGAPVGLGTDGPASNGRLDVLQEAKRAALVHKDHRRQADLLPAGEALRLATREGALALGFDGLGRVAEGYSADLALVDVDRPHLQPVHDPVAQAVHAARAGDVRLTVADGELVYEEGAWPALDAEAIVEDARQAARELVQAAESAGDA
jgi:5-methylthioadenosine/S-adenosylhomocysteine deaminase